MAVSKEINITTTGSEKKTIVFQKTDVSFVKSLSNVVDINNRTGKSAQKKATVEEGISICENFGGSNVLRGTETIFFNVSAYKGPAIIMAGTDSINP
ncbi:MAG: hypothetical protein NVSMB45_17310 [Ginsengibacter sp.]